MVSPNQVISQILYAVITYFIIVLITAFLWFEITDLILTRLPSLPLQIRDGYANPFSSFLAITAFFVFISYIMYAGINTLVHKITSSIAVKVLLGFIAGIAPVVALNLSTFGLPIQDPAMWTELIILGMAGAALPLVQKGILKRSANRDLKARHKNAGV